MMVGWLFDLLVKVESVSITIFVIVIHLFGTETVL